MLPLTKEYLHSTCEIISPQGQLICTGTLDDISQDTIQIGRQQDVLPILHCDTFVTIHVLGSSLESKSLVGKVYLSTDGMMRIIEVQNVSDFERRDFFRLKLRMPTQAYLLNQNDAEAIQLFPVTLTDLSLGGCMIETKKELQVESRVVVALPLTDSRLSFTCQVQRVPEPDGPKLFYGCMFLEVSKRQSDLLCKFIFEKQREQIQQARSHFDSEP